MSINNKLNGSPIVNVWSCGLKSSLSVAKGRPAYRVSRVFDASIESKIRERHQTARLDLKESFVVPNMDSDISTSELKETKIRMISNSNSDYSTNVPNPYGHGYISSLNEVRNNDAKEIQEQETTIFALAAVTGVSFIVLGILITSSSDISPTASQ